MSAWAQSRVSEIAGRFLRSRLRIRRTAPTSCAARRSAIPGALSLHDPQFEIGVGVVDVQVQAAALERIAHVPRVVGGQEDGRNTAGFAGPDLRNGDLEIAQNLEQERLELGIGLVDLVDQQHDRPRGSDGLQQRTGLEEALREKGVRLHGDPVHGLQDGAGPGDDLVDFFLDHLGVEQLLGVLPLVERLGLVQPLIALQPDERPAQAAGHRLGQLGLTHSGRPFDQDRLVRGLGQKDDGGNRPGANVAGGLEGFVHVRDTGKFHYGSFRLFQAADSTTPQRGKKEVAIGHGIVFHPICFLLILRPGFIRLFYVKSFTLTARWRIAWTNR